MGGRLRSGKGVGGGPSGLASTKTTKDLARWWLPSPAALYTDGMHRAVPYIILVIAAILGGLSLFAFWLFLLIGPFNLMPLKMGEMPALILNTFLSLLFFVQHSGMVRRGFKTWSARFIPSHYQGALYTCASGVALLVVLILWQESARTVIAFHGIPRWLLRGMHGLALAGFAWGGWSLGGLDSFGLGPIRAHLSGASPPSGPFAVRGPYRWVRHPLYLFTIMMLWSYPDLTLDRLLFNVLWSLWIIVGTVLEERDLVTETGQPYRDYQRTVPMLIPYRVPKSVKRRP
jgi:methanethiol S-methyltransferase